MTKKIELTDQEIYKLYISVNAKINVTSHKRTREEYENIKYKLSNIIEGKEVDKMNWKRLLWEVLKVVASFILGTQV